MDWGPPGSSLHGISQASILEWIAISFSGASSRPRDQTQVSWVSCIACGFFTIWTTWEALLNTYVNNLICTRTVWIMRQMTIIDPQSDLHNSKRSRNQVFVFYYYFFPQIGTHFLANQTWSKFTWGCIESWFKSLWNYSVLACRNIGHICSYPGRCIM